MKKLTLKDIAAHFNVSISTISKALKDSYEIGEPLRLKIQDYAKEHNYRPNKLALNLRNNSTKTIGVVIPNILNYFFTQIFYGIEKVANEAGYTIISCISNDSYEKESQTVSFLNAGMVDGLIISLAKETQHLQSIDHIQELVNDNLPLVMIDRVSNEIACDKVIVDDFMAGFKATNHLLELGLRNIVVISKIDWSSVGKLRVQGYIKALKEAGCTVDNRLIVRVEEKDDIEILLKLVLDYKKIDAIIALDEMTAVEVLQMLKGTKYRVPEDISLIGFTNGKLSKYVSPALTTINQHGSYIGETAATMLINRIEGEIKNDFITKQVATNLIVRESTKIKE